MTHSPHERSPKPRAPLVHSNRTNLGLAPLQRRRIAERSLRPARRERARQTPGEHAQPRACASAASAGASRQQRVGGQLLEHHRATPLELQRLHATLVGRRCRTLRTSEYSLVAHLHSRFIRCVHFLIGASQRH